MSWREWLARPLLRVVLVFVGVAAVGTVAGLVWLWPGGSAGDTARAEASDIGLASERFVARVDSVTDAPCSYQSLDDAPCRSLVVIPDEGPDAGAIVALGEFAITERRFAPDVAVGESIIVGYEPSTSTYFFADIDRRQPLIWLVAAFAVVVVALARWRGVLALVAMGLTLVLLVVFVAPAVLDGRDPLVVSVVAASVIAFVTLYLTHGFTPSTTVALAGTLSALVLTLGVSWLFFREAQFTGLASEEGLTLPFVAEGVNLSSLILGGAILGALGALDDVTVTQVATVGELHRQNPALRARDLMRAGIRVGREHIAATVNTLLLAYVGASMPLLLLFAVTNQSFVMVTNSELIAVEIFRTLCGSIGLVAAVPVTTALAAAVLGARDGDLPPRRTNEERRRSISAPANPEDAAPSPKPPNWDDFGPRSDLDL